MLKKKLSFSIFSFSLLVSFAHADELGLTITSNHRYARGGDTASICTNNLGNSAISCDFLDRGPNCATDSDEQFFDRNNADPNQQQVNINFFAHCNKPSTSYTGQGVGPQFVIFLRSVNSGASGQLDSCILLANQSSAEPTRTQITVYEDLSPSGSTPRIPGCQPNEYALLNLQSSTPGPNGSFTAQIACQEYFGSQTVVNATLNRSDLHYVPCPNTANNK